MVKTGFAEKSRIRGLVELRSRFFNSGREKVWHKWIDVWRPWRHSNYECQQEDPCRVRRDQDKSGGMVVRGE